MLGKITIENFRSLEKVELVLSRTRGEAEPLEKIVPGASVFRSEPFRLVALYGPTASGKSSVLYAPVVLKNFVVNPNRPVNGLFHLGFTDLGGFRECVFNHEEDRWITLRVAYEVEGLPGSYSISLSNNEAKIEQTLAELKLSADVAIPYNATSTFSVEFKLEPIYQLALTLAGVTSGMGPLPTAVSSPGEELVIHWNGFSAEVVPKQATAQAQERAKKLSTALNASVQKIRTLDIVPHRRGFFKPSYSVTPASAIPTTEDEVASLILSDPVLGAKISTHAEEIVGRDFRVHTPPGTAMGYFYTTEKKTRTPSLLVNDGFGVNQVIYMLAKILRSDVRTVLIEEPEVHLHPSAVRNLARQLCRIVKEENKQIILTTHSEVFVSSLLAAVAEKLIPADQVLCYLATKEGRKTVLTPQEVNELGQVEGGLTSFVEAELEDLRKLLGISGE